MHQLFGVGDPGPEDLADGLMAQADSQNWNLRPQTSDHVLTNPGVLRSAGARRQNDGLRLHLPDFLKGERVVADHTDFRINAPDILIQIVREAVVIIYQQNHSNPSSAIRMASTTARALFTHSWYSFSGTLSATIPAPDCTHTLPFFL